MQMEGQGWPNEEFYQQDDTNLLSIFNSQQVKTVSTRIKDMKCCQKQNIE